MAADESASQMAAGTSNWGFRNGRDRLAIYVVVGSFLTLFLLVGTLVGLAQAESSAAEVAKNAFTAILPVLAGWVGTVLAFYFSAASQERTSASLDKVIDQAGGRPGPGAMVSEKMIPYAAIVKRELGDVGGKTITPKDIPLSDLDEEFERKLPNGGTVSRLPFVEKGVFKYVLHAATLNAFKVKSPDGKTFADLLADEEMLRQISKLLVFVSAATTIADAKAALDKVNGAQDIIVTGSGNATEPMLGWLSNVDLIKAIEVA